MVCAHGLFLTWSGSHLVLDGTPGTARGLLHPSVGDDHFVTHPFFINYDDWQAFIQLLLKISIQNPQTKLYEPDGCVGTFISRQVTL